ncbi:lipid-A-disaccharide synthase N-terminal domain-containing protein [Stagnihabitans tardus]|nr:lipid-A-disaccharide synthase N-terminal domain-containing protein [Stagnihabitans tardus]
MYNLLEMMGVKTATDAVWVLVGIGGQLMFTARFLMQWWASEKAGRSVVPVSFWYFSIAGSLIVLAYGIREVEPVIILGQLPGTVIYTRNLWLIRKERERLGG